MAGEMIRIYVHPEIGSCVYGGPTDLLPSVQEAYMVDGRSPDESFTIICSPTEIREMAAMESAGMPYERWASLEKDLMERGKIRVAQEMERPFPIIANVRSGSEDPFFKQIPICSGRDFLVKKYEFRGKK
jgi:hypothetical protein